MPALLALALVVGIVELDGDTTCPTPQAVAERLRPLLPEKTVPRPDRVRLLDGPRIELRDAGGQLLAERRLDLTAPCDELAAAAAAARRPLSEK